MKLRRIIEAIKAWASRLRRNIMALWLGARDERVPLSAKLLAGMVAAYALSPIDLIPDIIPIIGFLDELVLLPLGIALAIKLIPANVMADLRTKAASINTQPVSMLAAIVIAMIWLAVLAVAI